MGVLSCLDGPETSGVHCPAISVHEFFDRSASSEGWPVQWETVPPG
jgi:hypothetical protein